MAEVHEGASIIDSRDVIARIEELEGERDIHEEEREERREAGEEDDSLPWDEEEPDDADELEALLALAKEGETLSDWVHGEALISDDYFEDYAREMAEDIGAISNDASWPNTCIDWKQAAEELQQDYTSIRFGDTDYWARA